MLTPITAPPVSITLERHAELTSSTPASFSDIPPVLRWENDATVELATPGAPQGWASGVAVPGRLYVTEEAVAFVPATALAGFTLPFPALTLHALTPAGDRPAHIYCQLDETAATAPVPGANGAVANGGAAGFNGVDEEEYAELGEMRLFVAADQLEPLFSALSACSALHDSLMPNGEPASFFGGGGGGFGDDDDDDEWDDDDDGEQDGAFDDAADGDDGGAAGRDMGGGQQDSDADAQVDAVADFLAKVDWGNVPAPGGWVDVPDDERVVFPIAVSATADATADAPTTPNHVPIPTSTFDAFSAGASAAQEQVAALQGQVAQLESQLEATRARMAQLEAQVASERTRSAALEREVAVLRGAVAGP